MMKLRKIKRRIRYKPLKPNINKHRYDLVLLLLTAVILLSALHNTNTMLVFNMSSPSKKTVVLDPGHGGIDSGTQFQSRLFEKDINLEVSLLIKSYLESKNVEVIMTRERDRSLEGLSNLRASRYRRDLDARRNIANGSKANILVSIHVNARPSKPSSRGVQVYYYPNSSNGKRLAASISKSIKQKVYKELLNTTSVRSVILSEDFFMLREVTATASLVEIGYMTNTQDRALLQDDAYKKQMAVAVGEGILNYLQ